MDDADITGERAEFYHLSDLERSRKPEAPKASGYCLYCEDPVPPGSRWCDTDCRNDWEKVNAR